MGSLNSPITNVQRNPGDHRSGAYILTGRQHFSGRSLQRKCGGTDPLSAATTLA